MIHDVVLFWIIRFISLATGNEDHWHCPRDFCIRPSAEAQSPVASTEFECFYPPVQELGRSACALEGQFCQCDGRVWFGSGSSWGLPKRVNDDGLACTSSSFLCGDPLYGILKLCLCEPFEEDLASPITHGECAHTPDAAISGHNCEHLYSQTVASCAEACRNATWGCKSYDWYKGENRCDLSDKSASDVGGLKTDYPGNEYDHYSCVQDDTNASSAATAFQSPVSVLALNSGTATSDANEASDYNVDSEVSCIGFSVWVRGQEFAIALVPMAAVRYMSEVALRNCLGAAVDFTAQHTGTTSISVDFVIRSMLDRREVLGRLAHLNASSCFSESVHAEADVVARDVPSSASQMLPLIRALAFSVETYSPISWPLVTSEQLDVSTSPLGSRTIIAIDAAFAMAFLNCLNLRW